MASDYTASDRAADEVARSNQADHDAIQQRAEKRIAGALMETLAARDKEVLEWMCGVLGQTPGQIAFDLIRAGLIKERSNFREAKGGGGASSRDIEKLTQRL